MAAFTVELMAGVALALIMIALWRRYSEWEVAFAAGLLCAAALFYPFLGAVQGVPLLAMPIAIAAVVFMSLLAWLGYRRSLWFLALGWGLHGIWDLVVPLMENVEHMPHWYAGLCIGFDIVVGAYFALRALGKFPIPESTQAAT